MSRRRAEGIVEGIAGLIGLLLLLCMLDPKFKAQVIALCYLIALIVFIGVLGLVAFLILRSRRRRRLGATGQIRAFDLHTLNASVPEVSAINRTAFSSDRPPPADPRRITEDDLRRMDWFQFEKVMGILYAGRGWRVEYRGGANPDGGIDLALYRDGERVAVQCKHWQSWKVRERDIRDFYGGMKIAGFERGIYATLEGCTSPAQKLASDIGISIIDLRQLRTLLDKSERQALEKVAALLDDPTKHCPKCGAEMVIRTARKGPEPGAQFWGCARFPHCNGKMRLAD